MLGHGHVAAVVEDDQLRPRDPLHEPGSVGGRAHNGSVLLARIVETSQTVAATRSRKAKVAALAGTLAEADGDDLEVVTASLGGSLLQRRTGVGWRGIGSPPEPASQPSLS